jgi:hypothetical protein
MHDDRLAFNRRAVRPIDCVREGWLLIKDDYWFFVGMSFIAGLIMYLVPFAIMVGPMMCGIHLCLLHHEIGRRYSFETLFDGFDYFVQSLIATMIWYWPTMFLAMVWYVLTLAGMIGTLFALLNAQAGQPAPGTVLASLAGVLSVFTLAIIATLMIVEMLLLFTYPLIVDRELSGIEALLLSVRAVFGNFWGGLGLALLITLITFIAAMPCCLGLPFVTPLEFAMVMAAYRQVFPREERRELIRPQTWDDEDDGPADTGIQTEPNKRRADSHVQGG